jgi:hypothetical protein
MEATMPVIEFALDPHAQHRIQVHIPIEQTAYTVLLNRSILGFLKTPEEQFRGKYFLLPDRSNLYVRIEGRRPQVFRNNMPLPPLINAENNSAGSSAGQTRRPAWRWKVRQS